MTSDVAGWLAAAVASAAAAADVLQPADGSARKVVSEKGRDIKLAGDRLAETAIVAVLRERTPFPILSEESGTIGGEAADGWRWIVDPLDGSFNYSRRLPFYCISVALWRGEEPIIGVVHDPYRSDVFTGAVGDGAWLNGDPVSTSMTSDTAAAVICTGFPLGTDLSEAGIESVVARVQSFKKVRMIGSAALSLAYVASGRVDVYTERGIRLWDVAAGLALVRAAGGRIAVTPAGDSTRVDVVATNGAIGL